MPAAGGARSDRRPVSRPQPFAVQEPAVLRRRRRAHRHRRARHGASRRPDPPHAADRVRVPGRLRRDLGAAAAQRVRLRMADLSGDPAEPAAASMGLEAPCARSRRAARAVGGARRRLFRASIRDHLPRPRRARRRPTSAHETDGCSLAAMFRSRRALPPRRHSAWIFIDALAPVAQRLVGTTACRCRPASIG